LKSHAQFHLLSFCLEENPIEISDDLSPEGVQAGLAALTKKWTEFSARARWNWRLPDSVAIVKFWAHHPYRSFVETDHRLIEIDQVFESVWGL
jgi:hypothetical protein